MALNGSVTIDATPNSCDLLVFSWEAVQDQKANTSAINWTMNLVASEKYGLIYGVYAQKDWTVTIDGQETTGTADINIGYGETKTLATGTTVVNHEADGTKTFDFEFGINMDISGWGSKTETHDCPDCDGTGEYENGDTCSICEGSGELTTTTEGVYIGWQRGSGSGELDPIDVVKKFPIRDYLNGLVMALCSPRRAFPQREPEPEPEPEPIGYLYGHIAKEGETPTHTINGVDYVGFITPAPPAPFTEYKYQWMHKESTRYDAHCANSINYSYNSSGRWAIGYDAYTFRMEYEEGWHRKPGGAPDKTAVDPTTWANFTIYNENGSVYLEKCPDPIPIYE